MEELLQQGSSIRAPGLLSRFYFFVPPPQKPPCALVPTPLRASSSRWVASVAEQMGEAKPGRHSPLRCSGLIALLDLTFKC
jgi:hypothetical protein